MSVSNEKARDFFTPSPAPRSISLCVQLKDGGGRQRQARKFATTSCHGQPASFASRSYQSVHDCAALSVCGCASVLCEPREICFVGRG